MPPYSLLSVDGLIKLRMQRVFIGALCRQMSSCNQSERDAIFGRDSYERKLSNHHDQGRRQGATAIIEFFSVTHTSNNFEGARGACVRRRGAPVPRHNGTMPSMASPSLATVVWPAGRVIRRQRKHVDTTNSTSVTNDILRLFLHHQQR